MIDAVKNTWWHSDVIPELDFLINASLDKAGAQPTLEEAEEGLELIEEETEELDDEVEETVVGQAVAGDETAEETAEETDSD